MTRRELVRGIVGAVCAVWVPVCGAAVGWALPTAFHARGRKTVGRAHPSRFGTYPGKVVPMGDIRTESKWSG